ncbi:LysR family transcriptional regulator [Streptomyces sp. NPDC059697]|uniref:LysR family transcriptional regulator n=1 Tax=Streptomyces sp. NPDC059697 TaxID=3346912 RepID=UPI00367A47A7
MDVKQLKALVTVAEVGSVTRAAELLHLVQPAVTRQIRTLEEELGVALFERTHQSMRPTEAGTLMVERARRALNELERARAEIQPAPGAVTGIVTVGLLESATDLLAEPLVSALARDRPGIELRLMTAYSGHLQQWLDDGDLDLSLLYDLASTPSPNAHPLVREHLWAVAPPDGGLRPDRPVAFARVAAHPLVMPTAVLRLPTPGRGSTPRRHPGRTATGTFPCTPTRPCCSGSARSPRTPTASTTTRRTPGTSRAIPGSSCTARSWPS